MKLKPGVKLAELQPQMVLAALIVDSIYRAHSAQGCTITSANDSTHSEHSWHYKGRALDFRTHDFEGSKTLLLEDIKAALGPEFDVLLEFPGGEQEHIHVEWDPKS